MLNVKWTCPNIGQMDEEGGLARNANKVWGADADESVDLAPNAKLGDRRRAKNGTPVKFLGPAEGDLPSGKGNEHGRVGRPACMPGRGTCAQMPAYVVARFMHAPFIIVMYLCFSIRTGS